MTAITREYDLLGRMVSYTDADGATTVTEYDRYGKPVKASDPTGHTTLTYDRTVEPRGFVTSTTDSVAGTFAAKYSSDGQLTELKYPGGMTRTDRLDANLQPVERTYTRDSDAAVIYQESVVENAAGQWVHHTYTGGSKIYTYDRLGRLTKTRHDTAITEGCVTRTYTYDNRSNRTNHSRFTPALDGSCDETAANSQQNHTYDSADRMTDADYVYDAFGRITTLPSGLTNQFYVNDLVHRQQLGDARQTWTLDPQHRFRTFTTETLTAGSWDGTTSKLNHYGDDSDEPRWTIEDTTLGTITRNVSGPDGDLAATTSATGDVRLHLTNLHGDVVVTIDPPLTEPELFDYEEFGTPLIGQAAQRYGWLGGKQRSGESLGDVILMGVRLYDPATGRFLSVDPVQGGSANDYDYANQDPINSTDLDGRCPMCAIGVAIGFRVGMRYAARYAARRAAQRADNRRILRMAGRPPARPKTWSDSRLRNDYRGRSWGYQINYVDRGRQRVYKYGITSASPPTIRAGQSLAQCQSRYRGCAIVKIRKFPNRYAARWWEFRSCRSYVIRYGQRPPGMRKYCR